MHRPSMLRVAVTDRCNLRCAYCMPASGISLVPRSLLLSLEDLATTVAWIHELYPLRKIKITGGEPLVRQGLPAFVRRLADLPGSPEISMTTNGSLLEEHAAPLRDAGLARVNVSLDTVDALRYRELTRGGNVGAALSGLAAANRCGLLPIKLNSVLRKSSWRADVPDLLDFAVENGFVPRFLELMRTGTERHWSEGELVSADQVRSWLADLDEAHLIDGRGPVSRGAEPARYEPLMWRGETLEVGWILPQSRPFCATCNRLRLDPRGRVRRCLMDASILDLSTFRSDLGDEIAARQLAAYVAGKRPPFAMDNELPMSSLGG